MINSQNSKSTLTKEEVMADRNYKYSIELGVDCPLTESEKNQLMIQMSEVLEKVLGRKAISGTTNIYSEKE